MNLPFASAADENKQVILEALRPYLLGDLLEIGSGTGQHAVHFCRELPRLRWQPSDLEHCLAGIRARIAASGLENLAPPLPLDVLGNWPERSYDTVYSANTFHIISEQAVAACIEGAAGCLCAGGHFAVYGPFNYGGRYTSDSNARFDAMLRASDPASGIRNFETLNALAERAGLEIEADLAMPANNRCLVWKKRTFQGADGLTAEPT